MCLFGLKMNIVKREIQSRFIHNSVVRLGGAFVFIVMEKV